VYVIAEWARRLLSVFRRRAPAIPILIGEAARGGEYVWPEPRTIRGEHFEAESRFYTQGDCITCPKCGHGNSTIATYCVHCHRILATASPIVAPAPRRRRRATRARLAS